MVPLITMRAALDDPDVFGAIFAGDTWAAWRIILIAAMGEPLTDEERITFTRLTGRTHEPLERVDELWAIIGRRGGKTRAAAIIAAYLAALVDYSDVLAPGERASLPILSATIWQSRKAFQYLDGIFNTVPALTKLVIRETADTISLNTRVDIECRPANYRSIRGGTACAFICDEVAHWYDEASGSSNPDSEILTAVRPCLATTNGPLIAISTPYARRGELFEAWKRDYGQDGDPLVMVAKADSRTMNAGLSTKIINRAFERDDIAAASEYGRDGEISFRSDVEAFLTREVVDAVTIHGRYELPRIPNVCYLSFVDPSGGRGDDMTLAIAHREGDVAVLDCIRCVHPPFNPDEVTKSFAATLNEYGVFSVQGDRYGGEWPAQRFSAHGINYIPSEHTKSEIYLQSLPLLMGGRVELLDNARLHAQLTSLERRTSRAGKDSVDHEPGASHHDDIANAACGALARAAGWSGEFDLAMWMAAYS